MTSQEQAMKEITEKFAGKWKEVRNEHLDDFLKEMGTNYFMRKMASQAHPGMEITVDGIEFTIAFKTALKNDTHTYKLDSEVELSSMAGKYLATSVYEDGKLVIKQRPAPGNNSKPVVAERHINEAGEQVITLRAGDVVCKRYFARQQ